MPFLDTEHFFSKHPRSPSRSRNTECIQILSRMLFLSSLAQRTYIASFPKNSADSIMKHRCQMTPKEQSELDNRLEEKQAGEVKKQQESMARKRKKRKRV